MKEAMGGIPIFEIVVVLILIFTGIMCLTINHSKAFSVKDEIISIIQKEESPKATASLSPDTLKSIGDRLAEIGYRTTGKCDKEDGWIAYDREGKETANNSASFCIKANNVSETFYKDSSEKCKNNKCSIATGDFPTMVYYDILLFYQLDIPLLKSTFNLNINGSTKVMFGDN